MKITQAAIFKLCKYENAFRKGKMYFSNGSVRSVKCTRINSLEEYIEGKVKGKHNYNLSIWTEDNAVTHAVCDCPAFEKHEGICKHIAAVLFTFAEKEEAPGSGEGSSEIAEKIIKSYKIKEREKFAGREDKAELLPKLSIISGHRYSAEFKIKLQKAYVIKDLCAFAENVKQGRADTYGKNAEFLHLRTFFSERSREYIRIIEAAAGENRAFNNRYNKYARLAELKARELELSGALLDRLLAASEGSLIELEADKSLREVSVVRENPKLSLTMVDSGGGVFVKTGKFMYLTGAEGLYVVTDNTLFITDEDFKEKTMGFITASESYISPGGFNVSREDMAYFYNRIIPELSSYVNVFWEGIDPVEFEEEEAAVSFYIDSRGSASAVVKCLIKKGERELNPFSQDAGAAYFDEALVYEIKNVLEKYMPYVTDEGEYFIEEEEEALFSFLSEGLDRLRLFGGVFVSERFERIKIKPVPKISVGLSLSGDLLELDFFSEEFDLKELRRLLKSYRRKQKYHRLKDGSFFELSDNALSDISEAADSLGLFEKNWDKPSFKVPKYRAAYLDRLFSKNSHVSRDSGFRALVRNIKAAAEGDFEISKSLKGVLRPYQKQGFRWLKTMADCGFGGILADDMGLGKSLQVLSLLLYEKEDKALKGEPAPVSLIVCPASLVYNWEAEIKRFTPELSCLLVLGASEERKEKLSVIDNYDVVITSYDLLKRDTELYEDKEFRFQIIDEAQYIKNHTTQSAGAVKKIKAGNKFALTGTPIENRLSELWSIFDYLMPGFLFNYSRFRRELEAPGIKDGDINALNRIKSLTAPFILRRLKSEVLKELPEKTETVYLCNMEEEQKKLYAASAESLISTLGKKGRAGLGSDAIQILAMLTRLRQLCCDPSLCFEGYRGGSSKLEAAVSIVKEATSGGHRVLLFSQFTSMLDIIESRFEEEGIEFFTLTGKTSKEERLRLVKSFQEGAVPVFLISLKAGGTGLNLTAADVVIHFDPWWNIAAQNQATDRTHRIGQKNTVTVYKLIARGSIEEKILELQKNKKRLSESVITGENVDITRLSAEELKELLGGN